MSSQWNEDAWIEAALGLRLFEDLTKKCIEFGAGDGLRCSNTACLRHLRGWSALLIEQEVGLLRQHCERDTLLEVQVQISGENSIDAIAARHGFSNASLMSIDVDGDEYHIVKKMKMRPAILIVEFNPTIPPHVHLIGAPRAPLGCSLKALNDLAAGMGYSLYAVTEANAIFILGKWNFGRSLADMFPYKHLSHNIASYDGKTLKTGKSPWGESGEEIPKDWILEMS